MQERVAIDQFLEACTLGGEDNLITVQNYAAQDEQNNAAFGYYWYYYGLVYTIHNNHYSIFTFLLSRANDTFLDIVKINSHTPLYYACMGNNSSMVIDLLDKIREVDGLVETEEDLPENHIHRTSIRARISELQQARAETQDRIIRNTPVTIPAYQFHQIIRNGSNEENLAIIEHYRALTSEREQAEAEAKDRIERQAPITAEQFLQACRDGGHDGLAIVQRYIAAHSEDAIAINVTNQDHTSGLYVAIQNNNWNITTFLLSVPLLDIDNGIGDILMLASTINSNVVPPLLDRITNVNILIDIENRLNRLIRRPVPSIQMSHTSISLDYIREQITTLEEAVQSEARDRIERQAPITAEQFLQACSTGGDEGLTIVQSYIANHVNEKAAITEVTDVFGEPALMLAASYNCTNIISALLSHITDWDYLRGIQYVIQERRRSSRALYNPSEMILLDLDITIIEEDHTLSLIQNRITELQQSQIETQENRINNFLAALPNLNNEERLISMAFLTDQPEEEKAVVQPVTQKITKQIALTFSQRIAKLEAEGFSLITIAGISKDDITCPLSNDIINDPVTINGQTFDRWWIQQYFIYNENPVILPCPVLRKIYINKDQLNTPTTVMIRNIIENFVIAQEQAAAEWRLNIVNEVKDVLNIQIEKIEEKEERPDLSVTRKKDATARLRFLMKKTQPTTTTDSQITQPNIGLGSKP